MPSVCQSTCISLTKVFHCKKIVKTTVDGHLGGLAIVWLITKPIRLTLVFILYFRRTYNMQYYRDNSDYMCLVNTSGSNLYSHWQSSTGQSRSNLSTPVLLRVGDMGRFHGKHYNIFPLLYTMSHLGIPISHNFYSASN